MTFNEIFLKLDERKTVGEKLELLSALAEEKASAQGYEGEKLDTFRHIYSSAILAKYYGEWTTRGLGIANEMNGERRNITREMQGRTFDPTSKVLEDSFKDIYNNELGIGQVATNSQNEEDIVSLTTKAIESGEAIAEPGVIGDFFLDIKNSIGSTFDSINNFFSSTSSKNSDAFSFISSAEAATTTTGGGDAADFFSGVDVPRAIESIGGRIGKGRGRDLSRYLTMSAAELARGVRQARRRDLEESLFSLFAGQSKSAIMAGRQRGGLPINNADGGELGFSDIFSNIIERSVGAALNRQRTRVTSAESDRSREASTQWNLSRSQQAAELARLTQMGMRNL